MTHRRTGRIAAGLLMGLGLMLEATPAEAQACSTGNTTRVIAYNTGAGPCPVHPHFSESALFPAGAPAPLSRFCLYTHPTRTLAQFNASAPGTLADTAPDCLVTMPQQLAPDPNHNLAMATAMAPHLANRFSQGIGAGPGLPSRVTVEVLDTLPPHEPIGPNSPHGTGMVGIARLAAGSDAAVRSRLAMGRVAGGAWDAAEGGYHGTVGDLAVALYGALLDHQPGHPLVINLSLGWRPGELGGVAHIDSVTSGRLQDPNNLNESGVAGPVRAVHAVLGRLACQGALVIAASGNIEAGTDDDGQGALLPAAWEALDAQCNGRPSGSLVLAAGGVDLSGDPISNARRSSEPGIVALAEDGSASTRHGFTWPMTGTSVSAAVLSGLAARYWSRDVRMGRDQVIAGLRAMGRPLGRPAELCGRQGCAMVRMVGLCDVIGTRCADRIEDDDLMRAVAEAEREFIEGEVEATMGQPDPQPNDWSVLTGVAVSPQPSTPVCPSCPGQKYGSTIMKVWVTLGLAVTSPEIVAVDFWNQPIMSVPLPSSVQVGKLTTVWVVNLPANAWGYRIEGKYNGVMHSSSIKVY